LIDWQNGVGNHSVCCDDLRYRNNTIEFQIPNSWGLKWGERGRGWLRWASHLSNPSKNHMFYAIRSTIDDSKSDNPPVPKE
jgi:C1A family cysteine protease